MKKYNQKKLTETAEYIQRYRVLEDYVKENLKLKTRLSESANKITGNKFIQQAEDFNNRFISNDESLYDLKIEAGLLTVLRGEHELLTDSHLEHLRKKKKYQNEIELFDKQFQKLKAEFQEFMSSFPQ